MDQLEVVRVRQLYTLHTTRLLALDHVLFTDDCEVRLMGQQTEHDQICIGAIETMPCVWVVIGVSAQLSDVIKHLVLTFSWHLTVREDARVQILVQWVGVQLVLDEEMKLLAEVRHEFGSRGDGVAVEELWHLLATCFDLSLEKSAFTGTSESSCSLLVHLGSWGDTVDRQEDVLLGLD